MRDMLPERPPPPRRGSWGWVCAQAAGAGAVVFGIKHIVLESGLGASLASAAVATGLAAAVVMARRPR